MNLLWTSLQFVPIVTLKIAWTYTILSTIIPKILIGFPTVGPDFATRASKWANVSHFNHCIGKVSVEAWRVAGITIYLRVSGSSIEEHLISVQETLLALQILEVSIVKGVLAAVKRGQIAVTTHAWTICLQWCCKRGIYVGLVVNPCSESWTFSLPNCVPSWNIYYKY